MMRPIALAALLLAGSVSAQTAISQSLFNSFGRYTSFAAAAYADSCATPPANSTTLQYFSNAFTDTHATLFRDDVAKEIIFSLRGTSSPKNLDTDLEFSLTSLTLPGTFCLGCKVHTAFQAAYGSISSQALSAVRAQQTKYSSYTVIITGHSLGAGLTPFAATHFAANGVKNLKVFSIAEPRNGDSNFANYINGQVKPANYYRITHSNDGVPQIPPTILGFQHHGTEYWESGTTSQTAATTYLCPNAGGENTVCSASQNYGNAVINGAHLFYTNQVIGNALNVVACGATIP